MAAELAITSDALRSARESEAAHLEAVLKVHGAKALRLAQLAEIVKSRPDVESTDVDLKLDAGSEPHVWLGLSHRITMEPDAKTYRLSVLADGKIEVMQESENVEDMVAAAAQVLAHDEIRKAWRAGESTRGAGVWSVATLIYVWATGFVSGAAGLALIYIYLKKLVN